MSTTILSGSWRETRASSTHGSSSSEARSAWRSTSGIARSCSPSDALVDLEPVHPLDAAHLDLVDLVAGVGRDERRAAARRARSGRPCSRSAMPQRPWRRGSSTRKVLCSCSSVNGSTRTSASTSELVLALALRTLALPRLRARLAADRLGVAADRLRHQPASSASAGSLPKWRNASAITISTSSA